MKYLQADIDEAQRLSKQAEQQVASQQEMIARMHRAGLSTDVAEEALRTIRKIVEQMHARLRTMTGGSAS